MTPDQALEKREEMLRDGFCIIEDIVTEALLVELRDETERLIANHEKKNRNTSTRDSTSA